MCNALSVPPGIVRATISSRHHNRLSLTGWSAHRIAEDTPWRNQIPLNWILDNVEVDSRSENMLAQALSSDGLNIVSDGSYYKKEQVGGAAWIVETKHAKFQAQGRCVVPGAKSAQSAYHSELMGILAVLIYIHKITGQYDLTEGTCTLHCDSSSSTDAITPNHEVVHNNRKHYDLIQTIKRVQSMTSIKWKFAHIKGHADDDKDFSELSH